MSGLKWRLDIINIEETNATGVMLPDTKCFFTLDDMWNFLGCKLKKERCGYAGIKGNFYYCLTRMK